MKTPDREKAQEALDAYTRLGNNIGAAAKECSITRSSLRNRLDAAERLGLAPRSEEDHGSVSLPVFPDDDIPVEEIIEYQKKRFHKRHAAKAARKWFPIKINDRKPIGLSFFGDPHVDDDGCHWPLLDHHCKLHAETDGLYGCNIGDSSNNWVGRLAKLFGEQEASQTTARKLAKWLLNDSGVDWLLYILGNHDMWNEGAEILKGMNAKRIPMEEWQARFKLVFPNGRECRIWAAHDFKGYSIWNSLHAPQRAAHTKAEAHIYACGHTHNWAMHQEESASREFTYWLVRSRGYKFIDSFAELHMHDPQKEGASITAVIDPDSESECGFIQCFADMDQAADFLTWKREKAA